MHGQEKNPFKDTLLEYAKRYIELGSLVFDLYTFIPYLNEQDRRDIVKELDEQIFNQEDSVRKLRATINLHKINKIFSFYTFKDDIVKTSEIVKLLHSEYQSFIKIDGKPEKGERKMADDYVILINEILEPYFHKKIDSIVLYRIGLLEYALGISPYNFDIQMQLVKLYDQLGLSFSFKEAYANLGCKGIQLESLGFFYYRHAIDWGEYKLLDSYQYKYNKYFKMSMRDLRNLKLKALQENNYDVIENFIEFEDFNKNSYFRANMKVASQMTELIQNMEKEDSIAHLFENLHDQI